jgi:NAD(P)-dependent dehydrogenase (short-subunit alcohol dehydrogenase family)
LKAQIEGKNTLKTILITGSTKGIGFGLAENFLRLGHQVVISGRSQESVDSAVDKLSESYPAERITDTACDMRDYDRVQHLWDVSKEHFGKVDIWINNAGIGQGQTDFWDLDIHLIQDLIDTNITGAMFGARVALRGFREQGWGALYNMEGLGSDGRQVKGITLYGTSKRALNYLTDSLVNEVQGTGIIVGAISPGMVLTDLILNQYKGKDPEEWASARRIFNILMDKVETVTPFLAEKILQNKKNGARINWLSGRKAFWRFLTAAFSKRDLFSDLDI